MKVATWELYEYIDVLKDENKALKAEIEELRAELEEYQPSE